MFRNTVPLCFLPNGTMVVYHCGHLKLIREGIVVKSIYIPMSIKERLGGYSRLATRLLRLGVRSAISLDDEHIVYSIGNMLYEVNLTNGEVSKGWCFKERIRPLIFTKVKSIYNFENGIYFGGYLVNMDKSSVNIYRRINVDQWEVVYTFQQGAINHVHNVVTDPYRRCLWIFTGDFDEAAAIWKVTDNFRKVERVVCNDQKYRGCVAYALSEGLLYATDAPFAENFIYLMNPETFETKLLFPLHGSCIYGCQWKDNYVFSSSVEGDGRNTSKLEFLFGRKRGAGIKDDYVHMYKGNLKDGFQEVYKEKKDRMSFLFQYGVFKFPAGVNNSSSLFFQPVATNKNDCALMCFCEDNK